MSSAAPAYSAEQAQHDPIVRERITRQRRALAGQAAQLVDALGDPYLALDLIAARGRITAAGLAAAN
ncbi:MAG TPA: hypothetical protein VGR45_14985 [Stellaceae bacterium]|nr:hypothetical protein [Stellaceae bacterium]